MKNFAVKTLANAGALAVAVWILDKITLTGHRMTDKALSLIVVALLFGLVNSLVKPVVKLLTFPLFIVTLGLITLVVNALMLLLTSWIAGKLDVSFHVDGFGAAVFGGLVVAIVSWALHVVLPDED